MPRWLNILMITAGSSMAAMSVKGPPHCGQAAIERFANDQGREAGII